jgi:hypothetical protein
VRRVPATDKDARFTALLHHVDVDRLRLVYFALRPPGELRSARLAAIGLVLAAG